MKRNQLYLIGVLLTIGLNHTNAQFNFTPFPLDSGYVTSSSIFDGVFYSSVAFADIDGDNDQDLLITGYNTSFQPITKLYTNDGIGAFSEVLGTPFDGVFYGSVAFADIDGDNDQDLLITGHNASFQPITKLYINDGTGSFSEVLGTSFDGVFLSSIAFADIDGDNDQDVLITGSNASSQLITKLYTNNGTGSFSEVLGTPFDGVTDGSVAFADIDGDNDQDVLITGFNASSQLITKLYTNNGIGAFSEVLGTPFDGMNYSSVAFADIDGDNDQDLLITGSNTLSQPITKLYINDGVGAFSEVLGTPFEEVSYGSIAFADIDGDNDQDLLITGYNALFQPITKLYTNLLPSPIEGVHYSSIAFADIDGDNAQDVLVSGLTSSSAMTKLYRNNGTGSFMEVLGTPFNSLFRSSVAFADIDGDNDQDLLITGEEWGTTQLITKLYRNDGTGSFTEILGTPFNGVKDGSIAFVDVDGDNDQDVLITGENLFNYEAKLYRNDGTGSFTEVLGTPFDGVRRSSIAFTDIDNDNDQDVLITGQNISSMPLSKLYRNDGTGNFTEVLGTPFASVQKGAVAFADIDGDSDQDAFIMGEGLWPELYRNDGTGNFTQVLGTPFSEVRNGDVAFADMDNDNDQDLIITGLDWIPNSPMVKLYTNDGTGVYSEVLGTPFEGVEFSSIAVADVDNDNDQDVLFCGRGITLTPITKGYINNHPPNSSLPITLTSFKGNCEGNSVKLSWVTSTEINNDYFLVEKSYDVNFFSVTSISGAGNSTQMKYYSHTDTEISNQTAYYRLKQVDFDGSTTYSEVIAVAPCSSNNDLISIYPNPNKGTFNLHFDRPSTISKVSIINTIGQLVYQSNKIKNNMGQINLSISAGIYQVILETNTGIVTKKMIIR